MKIISLREARRKGLKHYFTGVPCSRGHVGNRYTSGAHCVECVKLQAKAYVRDNFERMRRYQTEWQKKKYKDDGDYRKRRIAVAVNRVRHLREVEAAWKMQEERINAGEIFS